MGVSLKCVPWSENYSILESSPYVDYGTNCTPEIVDGPSGVSFGLGGNYIYTTTDIDTSVGIRAIQGLVRKRIGDNAELGFSGSFLFNDRTYHYFVIDTKFRLPIAKNHPDIPVLICPDIGFGTGSGRQEWSFDFRFSTFFGYPILRDRVDIYMVPKIMLFTYPYHAEGDHLWFWSKDVDYATAIIYGVSAGLNFSLPMGPQNNRIAKKVMIKPEINYVRGKEPKLRKIDFSVTQVGLQVYYSF